MDTKTETRTCERCHQPFAIPASGPGRQRKMCHNCSPPVVRVLSPLVLKPPVVTRFSSDIESSDETPRIPSDLEQSVERELTELDIMDSPDAKIAIRLCRALDDPELTGTQIASLVKTLYSHLIHLREISPVIDEDEEAREAALIAKMGRRL